MAGDLTDDLRALIQPHTGKITAVNPAGGNDSDVTALIESENGSFFLKAMHNRPGGRRNSITRERLINPYVQPISPPLRWHTENDDWIALGFQAVTGRRADLRPGSPDLPVVVALLNRIGELPLPDVAQDWEENRWDRFCTDEAEADLLKGNALLYTDVHESNMIIQGNSAWAVDWSWPTRGAAVIDPAQLAVQLIVAGHSATSAEHWAARCTAWEKADPHAIDAFAAAALRMHQARSERFPDAKWLGTIVAAARTWADHRGVPA
ncbi:hypothetical protein [Streptomyces sp. NPDC048644]|uniref:hypothetical protein n=1 Tax=Streptomyces sp. NPDC048644 TaxID=3365582 RepID=UPI0037204A27